MTLPPQRMRSSTLLALLETFTMGCQKKHRRVIPHFAECLRNTQALHAIQTAENEGWPAASMQTVAIASGVVHVALRRFRQTAVQA